MHAARLASEIKKRDPDAAMAGWGGDLMHSAGVAVSKHYRELAFMGFTEVVAHLPTILKNFKKCKAEISAFMPDALILVDYPGFNMRMASFGKSLGLKVFYFISPQVWAWKPSRALSLKKNTDRMLVILPFEKEFYSRFAMEVTYTGHPLIDAINDFHQQQHLSREAYDLKFATGGKPVIAILPGSRKQEIKTMLPIMLNAAEKFSNCKILIAGAPSVQPEFYESLIKNRQAPVVFNQTYALLLYARAAVVTSGTAALETALFGVPQVVCYKGGMISYAIARLLVQVKYISLVNLVLNREVIRELIQNKLSEPLLTSELDKLLHDEVYREEMKKQYAKLYEMLGPGGACRRAAEEIISLLQNQPIH